MKRQRERKEDPYIVKEEEKEEQSEKDRKTPGGN